MRSFRGVLRYVPALILGGCALASAACGYPGFFAGTYSGTLTSAVDPQLQGLATVIIGPSTGTPDMTVHLTPAPLIDCSFDANRSGAGATGAMIPQGGCQLITTRGQLSWSWTSGLLTLSGTQLGLNLSGNLTAPYAPTSHAAGESFVLIFNGNMQP